MTSAPTIKPDTEPGRSGGSWLWTPPSIDYTWRDRAGSAHTVTDVTRVDFTPHHVVFWRGEVLVLAQHADTVQGLTQVPKDDA